MMLYDLRDEIQATNSTLVLSVDPETLDPQYIAMLEREFQVMAS